MITLQADLLLFNSPYPIPSPRWGEGMVKGLFHDCHGEQDAYGLQKRFANK